MRCFDLPSRPGIVLATTLAMAGCTELRPIAHQDPIQTATRLCMAQNPLFEDAWGCIQARYAVGQLSGADPRLKGFLKRGDDLASKVAAGTLNDAAAKRTLMASLPDAPQP